MTHLFCATLARTPLILQSRTAAAIVRLFERTYSSSLKNSGGTCRAYLQFHLQSVEQNRCSAPNRNAPHVTHRRCHTFAFGTLYLIHAWRIVELFRAPHDLKPPKPKSFPAQVFFQPNFPKVPDWPEDEPPPIRTQAPTAERQRVVEKHHSLIS